MFFKQNIIFCCGLMFHIIQLSNSLRVNDNHEVVKKHLAAATAGVPKTLTSTTKSSYQVFQAQPDTANKSTQYLPNYLQNIHKGFVDDDADDVIHIIEPPAHYQQLKRLIQQRGETSAWEQQRKLTKKSPMTMAQSSKRQQQPKAPHNKLDAQQQRQTNNGSDLLTLESVKSALKTERLKQRKHSKVPPVRQGLLPKRTYTLLTEQTHEQQQNHKGKVQRLGTTVQLMGKRVKRELDESNTDKYKLQKGPKLVAQIGDLLQNATFYLPDDVELNEKTRAPSAHLGANESNIPRAEEERFQVNCLHERKNFHQGASAIPPIKMKTNPKQTSAGTDAIATLLTSSVPNRRFGERLRSKIIASTLVNSSKTPQIQSHKYITQQQQKKSNETKPQSNDQKVNTTKASGKLRLNDVVLRQSSAELLYNDVMVNIQKMLQENNLLLSNISILEKSTDDMDSTSTRKSTRSIGHNLKIYSVAKFVPAVEIKNFSDFRYLNKYLNKLKPLPATSPIPVLSNNTKSNSNHDNGINLRKYKSEMPKSNWYLISAEDIPEQELQAQEQVASVFIK